MTAASGMEPYLEQADAIQLAIRATSPPVVLAMPALEVLSAATANVFISNSLLPVWTHSSNSRCLETKCRLSTLQLRTTFLPLLLVREHASMSLPNKRSYCNNCKLMYMETLTTGLCKANWLKLSKRRRDWSSSSRGRQSSSRLSSRSTSMRSGSSKPISPLRSPLFRDSKVTLTDLKIVCKEATFLASLVLITVRIQTHTSTIDSGHRSTSSLPIQLWMLMRVPPTRWLECQSLPSSASSSAPPAAWSWPLACWDTSSAQESSRLPTWKWRICRKRAICLPPIILITRMAPMTFLLRMAPSIIRLKSRTSNLHEPALSANHRECDWQRE